MKPCAYCIELSKKGRDAAPHKYLKPFGKEKIYRGIATGGYEEQDYKCTKCGTKLTYSNDKNDYGWLGLYNLQVQDK